MIEYYMTKIEETIKIRGVVSGQELALAMMSDVNVSKFNNEIYVSAIEILTEHKKITHILYTPPSGYSGVLYFMGGTKFEV